MKTIKFTDAEIETLNFAINLAIRDRGLLIGDSTDSGEAEADIARLEAVQKKLWKGERVETRDLYAASRPGGAKLTHAVVVDDTGKPLRVLCGRVKPENVCEGYAGIKTASLTERPTCPRCAAKVGARHIARLKKR